MLGLKGQSHGGDHVMHPCWPPAHHLTWLLFTDIKLLCVEIYCSAPFFASNLHDGNRLDISWHFFAGGLAHGEMT